MAENEAKLPINKLILLYFVEKTGAAVSNTQITQFALEYQYMDYFNLQQSIQELCDIYYLQKKTHNQRVLYYITDEGVEVLGFFHYLIPDSAKRNITAYLMANKQKIQAEMDVSANYFPTDNGEYLIKCALIEGSGEMLMEISLVTASKERAKTICENWKSNTGAYYKEIVEMLYKKKPAEQKEAVPAEQARQAGDEPRPKE